MNLSYAKLYLLILGIFLPLDLLWLGWLAAAYYQAQIGVLLADTVNWWAAGAFYLLYATGLLVFAVVPGLRQHSVVVALVRGAGFGFFTYMTYDLTNLATLPGWPLAFVMVDISWGTGLGAVTATLACLIGRRMSG